MSAIRDRRWLVVLSMSLLAGSAVAQAPTRNPPTKREIGGLFAGCAKGKAADCEVLVETAALMQVGKEFPQDAPGALAIYLRLCELKRALGCTLAGHIHNPKDQNWGIPKDLGSALAEYRKACGLGDGGACMTIGSLLAEHHEAERVRAEALVYFEKGCELKYAKSCHGRDMMRKILGDEYGPLLSKARAALKKLPAD